MDNVTTFPEVQRSVSKPNSPDILKEWLGDELYLFEARMLAWVWAHVEQVSHSQFVPGPMVEQQHFFATLLAPTTHAFVHEGGIIYFTDTEPRDSACVNVLIWDPQLKRRLDLAERAIKCMFELFQLRRIYGYVFVDNAIAAQGFEDLGFTNEGNIREYLKRGDKYIDTLLYGRLRREKGYGGSSRTDGEPSVLVCGSSSSGTANQQDRGREGRVEGRRRGECDDASVGPDAAEGPEVLEPGHDGDGAPEGHKSRRINELFNRLTATYKEWRSDK